MKILATCMVLVSLCAASAAEASCATAKLGGAWKISAHGLDGGNDVCDATLTTGGAMTLICLLSGKSYGSIQLDSTCKVTGTVFGQPFTGRTEVILTSSAGKPNLIIGYANFRQSMVFGFRK